MRFLNGKFEESQGVHFNFMKGNSGYRLHGKELRSKQPSFTPAIMGHSRAITVSFSDSKLSERRDDNNDRIRPDK